MFWPAVEYNGAAGAADADFARAVDCDAGIVQTCERTATGGDVDVAPGAHQPQGERRLSRSRRWSAERFLGTELAPKRAAPKAMTASMNAAGPHV